MWLREKIIIEYKKLIEALQFGKAYDYQHILDMINFLEIKDNLNNPDLIEHYFTNK